MPTILIRTISPYLHADILLGVFSSAQDAEQQRNAYFAMRTQPPVSDPWFQQPYKPDGLKADDLVILDIQGPQISPGDSVFVISSYSRGFGQICRSFISVRIDKAVALSEASHLQQADTDSFPNYFQVQEAVAGRLLSDDPGSQPVWYK